MGIQTPLNITPALAAQLVQITGGQADRAAEILQALTTLSDDTGADLTTLLNDIAAASGDIAAVKNDTEQALAGIAAIPSGAIDNVMTVKNTFNPWYRAQLFLINNPPVGQWVEAYNYTGSGVITCLEVHRTHSVRIYADNNLVVEFAGFSSGSVVFNMVGRTETWPHAIHEINFRESLRVEVNNQLDASNNTICSGVLYS